MDPKIFRFASVPEQVNGALFLESMMGSAFSMYHDIESGETLLVVEDGDAAESMVRTQAGMKLVEKKEWEESFDEVRLLSVMTHGEEKEEEDGKEYNYQLAYQALKGSVKGILIDFAVPESRDFEKVRDRIEERMSRMETRTTKGQVGMGGRDSTQFELYYGSDEKKVLMNMLGMLDEIAMANSNAYEVRIAVSFKGPGRPLPYLESKLLVLEEYPLKGLKSSNVVPAIRRYQAVPFSYRHAAELIFFSDSVRRNGIINTPFLSAGGEITVGEYLRGSFAPSGAAVTLHGDLFNLGMIVTGLPGTGKTASMALICEQVIRSRKTKVAILSPTEEWDGFAASNGLRVIRPDDPSLVLNILKCSQGRSEEQFYENLATLLAAASGAGPYTNSLEKVLLSAFSRVYRETPNPDPAELYEAVEESIIEQHGKRVGNSVKYTKHGENIRAALQNFRLLLMKPQFAYNDGIDVAEVMERGAVFDLSGVSNSSKPFLYALILNQLYSIADGFDTDGDGQLRMLVCVEEAQLVFGSGDYSAATSDLKQRIQNFRKKGVGLALITHNVTDIEPGIRRLLQTKIYFRQSSDVAKFAANDLIFDAEEQDAVITKLKLLDQRVCAVSRLSYDGAAKVPERSVFARVSEYRGGTYRRNGAVGRPEREIAMSIRLLSGDGAPKTHARLKLTYLGEKVLDASTGEDGEVVLEKALLGKRYTLVLPGIKQRETRYLKIVAQERIEIRLPSA